MDKKQQAKLLSEIMEANEKNGLYDSDISKRETTEPVTNSHRLTAVEWLVEELKSKGHALITTEGIFINVPNELIEQAKQMEKERISVAYETGWVNGDLKKAPSNGKDYYNETYNK